MGKSISSLNVQLTSSVGPFSDGLKKAEKATESFVGKTEGAGTAIGVLGAAATVAAVAIGALVAIGKTFALAAQFETANVQLTALTGSAEKAGSVLGQLRDFAKSSPFAFPELLDASKKLLAVGVSSNAIVPLLKQAGDVAAGTGSDIGSIADIFVKVAAEGKVSSRELKEFGKDGIPVVQTLAKQFHTTAEGVAELADNGTIGFNQLEKAFESMTAKGGRFNGILNAQANTLGGRWHTLTTTIEDDSAKIGEGIASAFHVSDVLGGFTSALDSTFEIGSKIVLIFSTLAGKMMSAFGPVVQTAINNVHKAISNIGAAINIVLDAILKLEGVTIPPPASPSPVKITTFLDPSSQTLTVQPELKRAQALISGSAASQAARYGNGQQNKPSTMVTRASTTIPKAVVDSVMPKHANVSNDEKKFGYSGIRTNLTDAVMGPDGNYHLHSSIGGMAGEVVTPEQFENLKNAQKNHQESVSSYGSSSFGNAAASRAQNSGGVSSIDNWNRNHKPQPTSIQNRNFSSLWRTQADADAVAAWNKAHPDRAEGGAVLPHPTKAQLDDAIQAQPGGSGPMSAPATVQPPKPPTNNGVSSTANGKENGEQLLTMNQWLYRIELNTRGSSGSVGATVVDF